MDSAAELHGDHDLTDVPFIVRGAVLLGLFEAVAVLIISLASRFLAGPVETVVLAVLCLLYTSPSPRDLSTSRMPSSA